MKNRLMGRIELSKFRWGHLSKKDRECGILGLLVLLIAAVFLLVTDLIGYAEMYPKSVLSATLILVIGAMIPIVEWIEAAGIIEGKYNKELNEIRQKYGIKERVI